MGRVGDHDGLIAAAGAVAELVVRTSVIRETSARQQTLLQQIQGSIDTVRDRAASLVEGAQPLARLAVDTGTQATEGARLLESVASDLERAVETAQLAMGQLSELTERVGEIGTFAQTINEIAAQTKMIALNAAIEAARAGEHGRGFSVVADEVSRLSVATSKATAKISSTVEQVANAGARSASSRGKLRESVDSLATGLDVAREATAAFGRIAEQAEQVASGTVELSEQCEEQLRVADSARDDAHVIGLAARTTTEAVAALTRSTALVGGATDSLAVAGLASVPGAGRSAGALKQLVTELRPLFDVPRAHAGAYLAIAADRGARGRRLMSSDLSELDPLLEQSMRAFAGTLCGVTVTVAPGTTTDRRLWMQWWTPGPKQLVPDFDPVSPGHYDYTKADWYRTPLRTEREYLSDPYFDEGGADAWIVTASVPIVVDGQALGVATADIDLEAVARLCRPALRSLSSPAALLGRSGIVVTSTDPNLLAVGSALEGTGNAWIGHADSAHVIGPDGARLSRLPTLDWALLELGAGGVTGGAPSPNDRLLTPR